MSSGPTINRGSSSGDIWTPWDFRSAVVKRFGQPLWDLAASERNTFGAQFITEKDDSLRWSWHELGGLLWLNCPYSNITPWVRKCAAEMVLGAEILLLVPASVGANWYWESVESQAQVYSVGRMKFDNCFDKHGNLVTTAYPKDLILAHYRPQLGHRPERMQRWRWQQ